MAGQGGHPQLQDVHDVQDITDIRKKGRGFQFLVKWVSPEKPSWENESALLGAWCVNRAQQLKNEWQEKNAASSSSEKPSASKTSRTGIDGAPEEGEDDYDQEEIVIIDNDAIVSSTPSNEAQDLFEDMRTVDEGREEAKDLASSAVNDDDAQDNNEDTENPATASRASRAASNEEGASENKLSETDVGQAEEDRSGSENHEAQSEQVLNIVAEVLTTPLFHSDAPGETTANTDDGEGVEELQPNEKDRNDEAEGPDTEPVMKKPRVVSPKKKNGVNDKFDDLGKFVASLAREAALERGEDFRRLRKEILDILL